MVRPFQGRGAVGYFPWAALLRPRLLRLSHFVADSLFAETLKGTNPVRGGLIIPVAINRHKILWRYKYRD